MSLIFHGVPSKHVVSYSLNCGVTGSFFVEGKQEQLFLSRLENPSVITFSGSHLSNHLINPHLHDSSGLLSFPLQQKLLQKTQQKETGAGMINKYK